MQSIFEEYQKFVLPDECRRSDPISMLDPEDIPLVNLVAPTVSDFIVRKHHLGSSGHQNKLCKQCNKFDPVDGFRNPVDKITAGHCRHGMECDFVIIREHDRPHIRTKSPQPTTITIRHRHGAFLDGLPKGIL